MTNVRTESTEQKERRRRWLSLAEIVGVGGLLIGGAGLYFNWQDRQETRAGQVAAQTAGARLELSAAAVDGGRTLKLSDAKHDLNDVTIRFPQALGAGVQRPSGEPAIDAEPFRGTMLRLTDGGADDRSGRLPVLISASYVDGDATRTASGIYDVIWSTHGRGLRGRAFELTGLRLRQRGGSAAALEAAWAREKP